MELYVGIDVGSTTTKALALDVETGRPVYGSYKRHGAVQVRSVRECLEQIKKEFPKASLYLILTGSGAKQLSEGLGLPYVQEVVANSEAIRRLYPMTNTAIELGGQDAKIIFFRRDEETGAPETSDMRMNGSCAGGTGAFIDEIASVLGVPVEQMNALAEAGHTLYDVSGRCGVYAKTDIQPLLNQGVSKENLALSAFHAIAKQTIGGLAQGMDIKGPVIFEGGPLTFNPALVQVFSERLGLSEEDIILPERPELMIAYGAALSLPVLAGPRQRKPVDLEGLLSRFREAEQEAPEGGENTPPLFETEEERDRFLERHRRLPLISYEPKPGEHVRAWLGIDSGSTTSKLVLLDEQENLLDHFYANNQGQPLKVVREALLDIFRKYQAVGASLEILGAGTTGYGELMFQKAFSTEYHGVETVAHARAVEKYVPDASFVLDIGGQDMKAIWLDQGVITNIVVNEACSSGCGSFLENFAASLHIPAEQIAREAFRSKYPAALGSRCTVFMNSSIVTAQRCGKQPEDIMAGLCRSIIDNVFTKVIRISNIDSLGDRIVVQGGTFRNDAVLRALEQYIGKEVTRAPYPGLMGAIGAALLTKEHMEEAERKGEAHRSFIGFHGLLDFSYTEEENVPCPYCGNHCKRTIVRFSNGNAWVTNNRCERGAVLPEGVQAPRRRQNAPDLFQIREKLLFQEYPAEQVCPKRNMVVGLPRVLAFWETMPFWNTLFRSLGFTVQFSDHSTRKLYERGLASVTSDTVCFPAKLVHGHIRNLAEKKVDFIFMPSVAVMKSENTEKTSESMCAVVKGYPFVLKNSDDPMERFGVPMETPLFYWYTDGDRRKQLQQYLQDRFGIAPKATRVAMRAAEKAQKDFLRSLREYAARVLEEVRAEGRFAVVLASRPYQNDSLVNHSLPGLFTSMGIPVLTADSLPLIGETDLSQSRLDIVNNFHARMLSAAVLAAEDPALEYVQIVSFGCGHDAYLSDEIARMMREISGKTPLVLKLDESDVQGPLRIRVRSFLETLQLRRNRKQEEEERKGARLSEWQKEEERKPRPLPDPYPVKFEKQDKRERVVLVPNTSHAFSRVMSAAMSAQGLKAVPLEIGREEAIAYGKRYVHNDICFPAQIVIGEAISALKSGRYDLDHVAVAMAKYVGDCRLTHYSALLRKALDDAGFAKVPILTNDDRDYHDLHPGFRMNLITSARIAFAMPVIDAMEALLRRIRPYELVPGSADAAFERGMDLIAKGLEKDGIKGLEQGFAKAIEEMKQIPYDEKARRPRVLIVGEYLLNFHPGANREIERYLERNGFEIIEAHMTDVIRKTYFARDTQIREYHIHKPITEKGFYRIADMLFEMAHDMADRVGAAHPLYEPPVRLPELVKESDGIIPHTFDTGEGVLIPAEILHHAKNGCRAFVILQPFGCLPNHIVGRGIAKKLKELYPDAQILCLDYDPDVSFANIENRLQMLIMNRKAAGQQPEAQGETAGSSR